MKRNQHRIGTEKAARRFPAPFVSVLVGSMMMALPVAGMATELGPEQRELEAASPAAAALVTSAERAVLEGRPKDAWELFGRAWPLARRSPLPSRGICRLALGLGIGTSGQRTAAQSACQNALMLGGTAEDMRNRVTAWVSGSFRPSMDDLVAASFAADGAVRTGVGQPWGGLAWGAIARRMGDRTLLDASISEARGNAPEQELAKHMTALQGDRVSFWVLAARGLMFLLLAVTAAHALLRARLWRGRSRVVSVGGAAFLVLLLTGHAAGAPSAESSQSPDLALKQAPDPIALATQLLELPTKAEEATKRGDHAAAARIWTAITEAVPERTYGFARLCDSLEASGERERAIVACRTALTRQGTIAGDYTHFVQLLLTKNRPLSSEDRRQIGVAVGQLDKEPRAAQIAERVRCDVAVHDGDQAALAACTAKLQTAAPADWRTASFSWELARLTKDQSSVAHWREKARELGAPANVFGRMDQGARPVGPGPVRVIRGVRWGVGAALILGLLAVAYVTGVRVRRLLVSR